MRKNLYLISAVLFFCIMLLATTLAAGESAYVPEALKPWKQWVIERNPELSCPSKYNDSSKKMCAWNSYLSLSLKGYGMSFKGGYNIFKPSWVRLPGSTDRWPKDVTAAGKALPVVEKEGHPAIFLEKGVHEITGFMNWRRRPKSVKIPFDSAILSLKVNGKRVDRLNIDKNGMLWFGNAPSENAKKVSDDVKVTVYRKVNDSIPQTMDSEINLSVSGRDRELLLGRFLLPDSETLWLESSLPARIEKDGALRIQVRAGKWKVRLKSRFLKFSERLKVEKQSGEWPAEEIWVFNSNSSIREVTIKGAGSIDPSQFDMPTEWKSFPAFLLTAGNYFEMAEEQRGDSSQMPGDLSLTRIFWLNFKGDNFTVKDRISGNLMSDLRLNMSDGYELGKVSVNGSPRLVTMTDGGDAGVELRPGRFSLEAVSRYFSGKLKIPAAGWNLDFSKVRGEVSVPPGYSILHVFGVDRASDSWVEKWNVWDLFLLLIIAVSIGKILGLKWGIISFLTVVLTYHESEAPLFAWLNISIILLLIKVIPEDKARKFRQILKVYLALSFFTVFIIAAYFSVDQIRTGLYPQLEHSSRINYGSYSLGSSLRDVEYEQKSVEGVRSRAVKKLKKGKSSNIARQQVQQALSEINISDKIQTGPGEPTYNWKKVQLNWNGPVHKDDRFSIIFISPIVNKILNFSRVFLIFFLLLKFITFSMNIPLSFGSIRGMFSKMQYMALFAGLFVTFSLSPDVNAQIPSETILRELEARLTKEHSCFPSCASMVRGHVEVSENTMEILLVIDVAAKSAVPLPGDRGVWFPETVEIGGKRAKSITYESGTLMVVLPEGRNRVSLKGKIRGTSVQVPFPLSTHNLRVRSRSWNFSGVVDGRVPGGTLQLDKVVKVSKEKGSKHEDHLLPDPIKPFVEVRRQIILGNEWEVYTEVERIAPARGAVNMEIPLIEGERLITSGVSVSEKRVIVSMKGNQHIFSWKSGLKVQEKILMKAPDHLDWAEIWSINAASKWHVDQAGIAKIKQDTTYENVVPIWKPRPGESLTFKISRPKPVKGETKTIQSAKLTHTPGKSTTENTLYLTINSSIGDKTKVTLPGKAVVQKIKIDGKEKIISDNTSDLKIPLHPGTQNIEIQWKESRGVSFLSKTPIVNLHSEAANVDLTYNIPESRWVLYVGGPPVGPAMLIWGVVIVLLIIAFALGKYKGYPVKTHHWMLLFIGMSTVENIGGVFIVFWFIAMAKRGSLKKKLNPDLFNVMQLGLVMLTIAAFISIVATVPIGLLSRPEMQITGNGSTSYALHWYQDYSMNSLPEGWIVSLPLWVYRIVMLLWSLWLAFKIPGWLKWGWESFSYGGLWRKVERRKREKPLKEERKVADNEIEKESKTESKQGEGENS